MEVPNLIQIQIQFLDGSSGGGSISIFVRSEIGENLVYNVNGGSARTGGIFNGRDYSGAGGKGSLNIGTINNGEYIKIQ